MLETGRLVLRPFRMEDSARLCALAGAREIADTMISVPHPYPEDMARAWIQRQPEAYRSGREVHFAVVPRDGRELIGAIELRDIDAVHSVGELSFWVGVPWWGRGYAFESAVALVAFGLGEMGLNRICAHHMVRNPASGRVLQKAGFKREGLLRERVRKWGVFEDVVALALLRRDWDPAKADSTPARPR